MGNRFAAIISRWRLFGDSFPFGSSDGAERVSSSSSVSCAVDFIRNIDLCRSCSKRSTRVELSLFKLPGCSNAASIAAAAAAAATWALPPKSPKASALPSVDKDSS